MVMIFHLYWARLLQKFPTFINELAVENITVTKAPAGATTDSYAHHSDECSQNFRFHEETTMCPEDSAFIRLQLLTFCEVLDKR